MGAHAGGTPREYIALRQAAEVGAASVCNSDGRIPQHRALGQTPRPPTSSVWLGARHTFPGHLLSSRHWEGECPGLTAIQPGPLELMGHYSDWTHQSENSFRRKRGSPGVPNAEVGVLRERAFERRLKGYVGIT